LYSLWEFYFAGFACASRARYLPEVRPFLAASFFLVVVYGKLLYATHHWFSEVGVLAAVYLLMCRRSATRIVLSGVLLGIVTFITQTRGPITAVAFIAYFVWDRYRTPAS
jgi:thiamine transporter ThiT